MKIYKILITDGVQYSGFQRPEHTHAIVVAATIGGVKYTSPIKTLEPYDLRRCYFQGIKDVKRIAKINEN